MSDDEIKQQLEFLLRSPKSDIGIDAVEGVIPLIRNLRDADLKSWYLSLAAQYATKLGGLDLALRVLPEMTYYYDKAETILLLVNVQLENGKSHEASQLIQDLEMTTMGMGLDDINDGIANWQKADVLMHVGDFYKKIGNDDLAIKSWVAADGFAQHDDASRMQLELVMRLFDNGGDKLARTIAYSKGAPAYRDEAIVYMRKNKKD